MKIEPSQLAKARENLASCEKMLLERNAVYHLTEGFLLLEEVLELKFRSSNVANNCT